MKLAAGPLIMGVDGLCLSAEEIDLLQHPLLGGVILFSRNYESCTQLAALSAQIRALRCPQLLLMVDQEGGRVQRFGSGFTPLPSAGQLGRHYDRNAHQALELAQDLAWLLATELGAVGMDLSLAPVLDVDWGRCAVIGDRAFHRDAQVAGLLGAAWVRGARRAGMASVGKHFPGHGWTAGDSHVEPCVDDREYRCLEECDLVPFRQAIQAGLEGMMINHVIYPDMDACPAVYSPVWIERVLRTELGFQGLILSDDICMHAAAHIQAPIDRAVACLEAGCDMVLVCNDRTALLQLVEQLPVADFLVPEVRLQCMRMPATAAARTNAAVAPMQAAIRERLSCLPV